MRKLLLSLGLTLAACGGEPEVGTALAFQTPVLPCRVEGLQAELQIEGAGSCKLRVNEDHSVEGVCPRVPTGAMRLFVLVYFLAISGDPDPLPLATAAEQVDLTGWTESRLELRFEPGSLRFEDTDMDRLSNIEEVCAGRDPRDSSR